MGIALLKRQANHNQPSRYALRRSAEALAQAEGSPHGLLPTDSEDRVARTLAVREASHKGSPHRESDAWTLTDLSGRLIEISASAEAAHLSAAFGLVLDAQLRGDRAAWVTLTDSSFFPPDVVDGGVDLDALPVVRVAEARLAGRAADHLLRSGGFGLVVLDLTTHDPRPTTHDSRPTTHDRALPVPLLTRLLGLARQHDAAVLLLTKKSPETPSLHSLISLRAEARWRMRDGRCELCIRALKDKRRGPGWTHVEACRGPAGLR